MLTRGNVICLSRDEVKYSKNTITQESKGESAAVLSF